jgi:hypothetical protein
VGVGTLGVELIRSTAKKRASFNIFPLRTRLTTLHVKGNQNILASSENHLSYFAQTRFLLASLSASRKTVFFPYFFYWYIKGCTEMGLR